jgi:GNAT superfamily N-acetyltransferase
VRIRDATDEDWPAIWRFAEPIFAAGETFSYDTDMDEPTAREIWMLQPPARTFVAVGDDGMVLGSANAHPNHGGPGAHIASGNFIVDPRHEGRGIGRALLEHTLDWARAEGYRGMQFNAVAATNTRALRLYESAGMETLATIPGAFHHPAQGYVDLHLMFRRL